ncbi:sigma-70 family RNA polymerase sigma factor [Schinkia azotoformans]|uniref:sigma-70 family RNA polymerase sigma factor n=1 Tax=Schinkia azotoformans TaxID=1454 RepID=UPI002DB950F3|nr:sigma-70 family RNA polymerase sigma factor [Schinkia azotoformans]MEC1771892.1 sigma-70 family RNA polymerase sigma factor [Schinkia azotoformans]MED4366390.1 sigma-70 family RNA polymerase sigma factor [Schinkia azotoformans]
MDYQNKSIEDILLQFEPMVKKQMLSLQIYKNQEEFFQIGLIGLWEAHQRFNPEKGVFPAFAQMTVRGKMLSHLRKETTFEAHHTGLSEEMFDVIAMPEHEDPLERENILSYCKGLSDKQLTWVMQGIFENKKPKEIAENEGVPVDRVKSWRREALKKILKNYQEIHMK